MSLKARFESANENLIAAAAGLTVFAFHAWHIPAVAQGEIFRRSNLAFDFDIDRFTGLWTKSPFPLHQNEDSYATRHPFAIIFRIICWPLAHAGLDAHVVACTIAAVSAALSTALIFKIASALDVPRLSGLLLAFLWSVSTTTLLLGVLPEAYGLALTGLTAQFLLSIRWMRGKPVGFGARVTSAVINFGITVTNAGLCGLAELVGHVSREGVWGAIRKTFVFGVSAGTLALLLSAVSFSIWPVENDRGPLSLIKRIYWSAEAPANAKGVMSYNQGIANVVWTFAGTSFVAPKVGQYASGEPTNPYLWDLRGQNYSPVGWAALLGWLGLFFYGVRAAVRDRERRPIWATASIWILFNFVLHDYWQYRGSLFVYGANSNSAFFVLALAGAIRPSRQDFYQIAVGLLILLVALNNLAIYEALPKLF